MKENTRNFIIGSVSILGMIGFSFLLLLFDQFDTSLRPSYLVSIHANEAMGLRLGSQITLAGVPIGDVQSVGVAIESDTPVRITARINGSIDIPAGVVAAISTSLIGGTARLDLAIPVDYEAGGATLPRDGNAVVTAHFEGFERRLSRILDEKIVALESKLDEKFGVFTDTLQSVNTLAKDAQKWLGDEQLLADSKSAVWKAQNFIDQATETTIALKASIHALEENAAQITSNVVPTLDQLSQSLVAVEALMKQAKDGKGTVGQLMNNPDLYNSLLDSAQRLKHTLGEADLLLQKIKAEGLGVKF